MAKPLTSETEQFLYVKHIQPTYFTNTSSDPAPYGIYMAQFLSTSHSSLTRSIYFSFTYINRLIIYSILSKIIHIFLYPLNLSASTKSSHSNFFFNMKIYKRNLRNSTLSRFTKSLLCKKRQFFFSGHPRLHI